MRIYRKLEALSNELLVIALKIRMVLISSCFFCDITSQSIFDIVNLICLILTTKHPGLRAKQHKVIILLENGIVLIKTCFHEIEFFASGIRSVGIFTSVIYLFVIFLFTSSALLDHNVCCTQAGAKTSFTSLLCYKIPVLNSVLLKV